MVLGDFKFLGVPCHSIELREFNKQVQNYEMFL